MPTKTERILGYLPGTFHCAPRLSALQAVVDAFGTELQQAENSLAAVMQAHWVDHADRGAEVVDDLACIAALYGLAPRADESVEGFRQHLKRYVRTFLEGTVTVQGILRVTAEALGLHIADAYEEMDTWWTRDEDELVTVEPCGDDAAELALGVKAATVAGSPDRPAQVAGTVDLSGGVDLREASILRLKTESTGPVEIDLAAGAEDPKSVTLEEIEAAISDALDVTVTRRNGRYLTLASPTVGPSSQLEVQDIQKDAAERVLGLAPRTYHGSAARAAQVTGTVDLGDGVGMNDGKARYLRLVVDGRHLAEIDCAGPDPANTTPDQICSAINGAFDPGVLEATSHQGRYLRLTCVGSTGFGSSIAFQQPAAQDATARLFGPVDSFHIGQDAQPARVTGGRDLSDGVDLSERSNIQLRVDGGASLTIDCAGGEPANTRPAEIVAKINAAFEPDVVARRNGGFITLVSPTVGPDGEIVVETPPAGDATEDILGIAPRTFEGAPATRARLIGEPDLSGGIDLMARHWLKVAMDGGSPVEIDLRASAADPRAVTLDELADAIDGLLDMDIATDDGQHLILTSPTTGDTSFLTVEPLETTWRRRFVTRATITDEASQAAFGFTAREAQGKPATSARIVGEADLSRGVDLREKRYLRLSIDNRPAEDIDCAGGRPRATLIHEVVQAINDALKPGLGSDVAIHDGRHLVLTSPSSGVGSRIAIEPPRAADALPGLLGVEPGTFRGQDATGINFVGTVDLSAGVELGADAAIKLRIDGAEPVEEITLGDPEPSHKTLTQIVLAINTKLGVNVASHDGQHIILTLPPEVEGEGRRQLDFAVPGGPDATKGVFGITPPRTYHGANAAPAQVIGTQDLSGGVDLQVAHFLRLAVDGGSTEDVDCAAQAADPVAAALSEIVEAINTALGAEEDGIASHDGPYLVLTSTKTGPAGRITLEPHTSVDARQTLLGDVEDVVEGTAPAPAVITGEADLLTPVDLSQRRWIRLAVDGGRPVNIDVAGAAPETTFLDEIVAAISEVFPGLASATEEDRLQLTSPTAGEGSRLSLLPLRYLELVEYLPESEELSRTMRHGDSWSVANDGAADVPAKVELTAPQGVFGPTLVSGTLGWRVRLLTILRVGETARLWRDAERGLQAEIRTPDGAVCSVPGSEVLVGPLGAQAWVPFQGNWRLTGDDENPATLQLNNPLAPCLVRLHVRQAGPPGRVITVSVVESDLSNVEPQPITADGYPARLVGRVRADAGAYRLVMLDADEATIVHLREGPGANLEAHQDRVVAVTGPLHAGEPPLMIVQQITDLFDVALRVAPEEGDLVRERYAGVTIGVGTQAPDSLVRQINTRPSQLVKAEELDKGTVLTLPRGRSEWIYGDCYSSRFNQARFDAARLAGGRCDDRGVFNVSRFAHVPPEPVAAVFASSDPSPDPAVEVVFRWSCHQPGVFAVNLPADLPARFGGRFNQARFGQKANAPEMYEKAVTEPPDDPDYLVARVNAGSTLVEARTVPRVPLGWQGVTMPFREPRFLTLGAEDAAACLYLAEEGLAGVIELKAREVGPWGNEIGVTARESGPAMYDVTVAYDGARFENAREVALGIRRSSLVVSCEKGKIQSAAEPAVPDGDMPALIQDLLRPGSIGVLQAKAAGVRADVSRDRTESICNSDERRK
jgi:hypothetical protein